MTKPSSSAASILSFSSSGGIAFNECPAFIGERIPQIARGRSKQSALDHVILQTRQPALDRFSAVDTKQDLLHFHFGRSGLVEASCREQSDNLLQLRSHSGRSTKHHSVVTGLEVIQASKFIAIEKREGGLERLSRQGDCA